MPSNQKIITIGRTYSSNGRHDVRTKFCREIYTKMVT